jgi:hypothetical protein
VNTFVLALVVYALHHNCFCQPAGWVVTMAAAVEARERLPKLCNCFNVSRRQTIAAMYGWAVVGWHATRGKSFWLTQKKCESDSDPAAFWRTDAGKCAGTTNHAQTRGFYAFLHSGLNLSLGCIF